MTSPSPSTISPLLTHSFSTPSAFSSIHYFVFHIPPAPSQRRNSISSNTNTPSSALPNSSSSPPSSFSSPPPLATSSPPHSSTSPHHPSTPTTTTIPTPLIVPPPVGRRNSITGESPLHHPVVHSNDNTHSTPSQSHRLPSSSSTPQSSSNGINPPSAYSTPSFHPSPSPLTTSSSSASSHHHRSVSQSSMRKRFSLQPPPVPYLSMALPPTSNSSLNIVSANIDSETQTLIINRPVSSNDVPSSPPLSTHKLKGYQFFMLDSANTQFVSFQTKFVFLLFSPQILSSFSAPLESPINSVIAVGMNDAETKNEWTEKFQSLQDISISSILERMKIINRMKELEQQQRERWRTQCYEAGEIQETTPSVHASSPPYMSLAIPSNQSSSSSSSSSALPSLSLAASPPIHPSPVNVNTEISSFDNFNYHYHTNDDHDSDHDPSASSSPDSAAILDLTTPRNNQIAAFSNQNHKPPIPFPSWNEQSAVSSSSIHTSDGTSAASSVISPPSSSISPIIIPSPSPPSPSDVSTPTSTNRRYTSSKLSDLDTISEAPTITILASPAISSSAARRYSFSKVSLSADDSMIDKKQKEKENGNFTQANPSPFLPSNTPSLVSSVSTSSNSPSILNGIFSESKKPYTHTKQSAPWAVPGRPPPNFTSPTPSLIINNKNNVQSSEDNNSPNISNSKPIDGDSSLLRNRRARSSSVTEENSGLNDAQRASLLSSVQRIKDNKGEKSADLSIKIAESNKASAENPIVIDKGRRASLSAILASSPRGSQSDVLAIPSSKSNSISIPAESSSSSSSSVSPSLLPTSTPTVPPPRLRSGSVSSPLAPEMTESRRRATERLSLLASAINRHIDKNHIANKDKLPPDSSLSTPYNLQSILDCPYWLHSFHSFCRKNYCVENLLFLQYSSLYQHLPESEPNMRKQVAIQIFLFFFSSLSPLMVNLDDLTRAEVETTILQNHFPSDLFRRSHKVIYSMTSSDVFRRFQNLPEFDTIVNNINAAAMVCYQQRRENELLYFPIIRGEEIFSLLDDVMEQICNSEIVTRATPPMLEKRGSGIFRLVSSAKNEVSSSSAVSSRTRYTVSMSKLLDFFLEKQLVATRAEALSLAQRLREAGLMEMNTKDYKDKDKEKEKEKEKDRNKLLFLSNANSLSLSSSLSSVPESVSVTTHCFDDDYQYFVASGEAFGHWRFKGVTRESLMKEKEMVWGNLLLKRIRFLRMEIFLSKETKNIYLFRPTAAASMYAQTQNHSSAAASLSSTSSSSTSSTSHSGDTPSSPGPSPGTPQSPVAGPPNSHRMSFSSLSSKESNGIGTASNPSSRRPSAAAPINPHSSLPASSSFTSPSYSSSSTAGWIPHSIIPLDRAIITIHVISPHQQARVSASNSEKYQKLSELKKSNVPPILTPLDIPSPKTAMEREKDQEGDILSPNPHSQHTSSFFSTVQAAMAKHRASVNSQRGSASGPTGALSLTSASASASTATANGHGNSSVSSTPPSANSPSHGKSSIIITAPPSTTNADSHTAASSSSSPHSSNLLSPSSHSGSFSGSSSPASSLPSTSSTSSHPNPTDQLHYPSGRRSSILSVVSNRRVSFSPLNLSAPSPNVQDEYAYLEISWPLADDAKEKEKERDKERDKSGGVASSLGFSSYLFFIEDRQDGSQRNKWRGAFTNLGFNVAVKNYEA